MQDLIERRMRTIVAGVAATFEMTRDACATSGAIRRPSTAEPRRGTHAPPPRRSSAPSNVETDPTPEMGSEDFAFMLQAKPGCYVWLGAGTGPDTPNIHNPHYDFNDEALAIGASYWVKLAEQQLPARR